MKNFGFCDFQTHERKCMGEHRQRCGPNVQLFQCYKCDAFKTSTKLALASHLNKIHGKNTKCDKCEFSTKQIHYMRKHEKRCYNFDPHKCDFCDYSSFEVKNVKNHMKACKANSKMYKCTICDFKASSNIAVTAHITKQHGQYTKCKNCVYQTSDFGMMRQHEKKCRGDEVIYSCEKCDLQMNFWHYRRHHKTCAAGKITKVTKRFTCRTCNAVFQSALFLKAHQNLKHEDNDGQGNWIVKLSKLNI